MLQTEEGTYIWIYEMDMKNNRSLYNLIVRIITVVTAVPLCFLLFLFIRDSIRHHYIDWDWGKQVGLICLGVIAVMYLLTKLSYWYISKTYQGTYLMLFNMDEEGISFKQVDDQKEKNRLIGLTAAMTGMALNNPGMASTGLLLADGGNLHTRYEKVRRIIISEKENYIGLKTLVTYNMIYADDADFEFVKEYLLAHCRKASVSYKDR